MTSAILTKLAETYPEVLTEPQKILGPNYLNVFEFWKHIEGLSDKEKGEMAQSYYALDEEVRWSAFDAAYDASVEVVGKKFSDAAWCVTGWGAFGFATYELVGNVENKVAYDLIMSHKQP